MGASDNTNMSEAELSKVVDNLLDIASQGVTVGVGKYMKENGIDPQAYSDEPPQGLVDLIHERTTPDAIKSAVRAVDAKIKDGVPPFMGQALLAVELSKLGEQVAAEFFENNPPPAQVAGK